MLLSDETMRRLSRLRLASRQPAQGSFGERPGRRSGAGLEFADFREYRPGDDLRYVDWKAFSRLDRPYLKLFTEEEGMAVELWLDASPSMSGRLLFARGLAACLGYVALAGGDPVTLQAVGAPAAEPGPLARFRGVPMAAKLFQALEGFAISPAGRRSESGASLAQALRSQLASTPGSGTGAGGPALRVLITDLLDEPGPVEEALSALRRSSRETLVLHLISAEELDPRPEGPVRLTDLEGGPPVELTLDSSAIAAYREILEEWLAWARSACARRGIGYHLARETGDVEGDLNRVVFQELRARGVLR